MSRIYLTGFMGTGKTTVGELLAENLGCRFVDLDALIVEDAGKSISDIFATLGEERFRDIESAMLHALDQTAALVVATGGGIILRETNRRFMRDTGYVINLAASLETIDARLTGDTSRPLLQGDSRHQRLRALFMQRQHLYDECDFKLETTGKAPMEIVSIILLWLKNRGE